MIIYLKDTKKESERTRQMGGRTQMLIHQSTKVAMGGGKWWYNENDDKHLFHKIQRSRFVMSPSTEKCICGSERGRMTANTLALLLLLDRWPDNVRHQLLDMGLI
jgi:hypothetical protein